MLQRKLIDAQVSVGNVIYVFCSAVSLPFSVVPLPAPWCYQNPSSIAGKMRVVKVRPPLLARSK